MGVFNSFLEVSLPFVMHTDQYRLLLLKPNRKILITPKMDKKSVVYVWKIWRLSLVTLSSGPLAVEGGFTGKKLLQAKLQYLCTVGAVWKGWQRLPDAISLNVRCATTARNLAKRCSNLAFIFLIKMLNGKQGMPLMINCRDMTGILLKHLRFRKGF